jgi:hypothetical protein
MKGSASKEDKMILFEADREVWTSSRFHHGDSIRSSDYGQFFAGFAVLLAVSIDALTILEHSQARNEDIKGGSELALTCLSSHCVQTASNLQNGLRNFLPNLQERIDPVCLPVVCYTGAADWHIHH